MMPGTDLHIGSNSQKKEYQVEDQVVIVTGGAAGIGGAITAELVRLGAHIVAVDLNDRAGEEIARAHPDHVAFLKGDISKEQVAIDAVALAISRFGKLTGLVNNAHASRQKPLMDHTSDDWALSFDTGFWGTWNFMKAAHSELARTRGSVVNFGSSAALNGQKNQASYAAAKEAIRGLRVRTH